MPTVFANFLNSEKGLAFLLIYVGTGILFAIGKVELTTDQWINFSTVTLGIYTGGKAIQGAALAISQRPANEPKAISEVKIENTTNPAPPTAPPGPTLVAPAG